MWHESRSEEKKMAGLMADRKKRAERRKEHYEKTLGDPNQFLQVHGRGLTVSLEPSVALAADAPANMMPWAGDPKVIIDRFDGRAALDMIPEYNGGPDHEKSESREEKNEQRSINYERYRILVQNEYLGVTEEKYLKTLELEEKFGENTYQSATAKEKAKEEKKKSVNKAAIGFVYNDSTGGVPTSRRDEKSDDDDEDEEDEEEDFDLTLDVMNIGPDQQEDINKIGKEYDMGSRHFFRFLVKEEEEKEEQRIARDAYAKKPPAKDEMGRKKRRSRTNVRVLTKSEMRRPAYAQRTGSESPGSRTASESSESDSEPGEEKVEFITSFGGDEEQETVKRWEEEVEEKRRLKRAHYEKPIGPRPPSPPGERRKRSRNRGQSRSRSRGRTRHSSSDSKQDQIKKLRTESKGETEKLSSSDSSSSEEEGGGGGYRSKYRNRRADSSDSSEEENGKSEIKSSREKDQDSWRKKSRDSPPRPPPPPAISVPKVEAPPPVKRYYGRRKAQEDSDSELSGLEEDKTEENRARAQPRPELGNANGGNGKMWSSRAKEESKALTIKEKLKKKMQQQLKKTFKEDKKAEKERLKKMEEEEKMREEELKEMSDKMRERVRERRRAEGEESSDEDDSPLSGLWRQDKERERERRRSRSRDRKRRSRDRSWERKGQRREEESRRGRRRSRSRSRDRKADERLSGPGLRLVDY